MTQLYIDGIRINGLTYDIGIPDMRERKASFSYYLISEDEGQILLDKAIYNENEVHEYFLSNDCQTWEFQGEVSKYNLIHDEVNLPMGFYVMFIEVELCGKFRYTRNEKLVIERDFTNLWKKGEQEAAKIYEEIIKKKEFEQNALPKTYDVNLIN